MSRRDGTGRVGRGDEGRSLISFVPRWVRCRLCDTRWLNDTGVCETCGGTKWEDDE